MCHVMVSGQCGQANQPVVPVPLQVGLVGKHQFVICKSCVLCLDSAIVRDFAGANF